MDTALFPVPEENIPESLTSLRRKNGHSSLDIPGALHWETLRFSYFFTY